MAKQSPLYVDPRAGSRDLLPFLQEVNVDIGARIYSDIMLDSGDFSWEGYGPENQEMRVGVEHKTIFDFVTSMRYKRVQRQVVDMCRDYDIRYLFIEGEWRRDGDGLLCWRKYNSRTGRQDFMTAKLGDGRHSLVLYSEVTGLITSMESLAGVKFKYPHDKKESAHLIMQTWRWWQKPWDDHKGLGVGGVGGIVKKTGREATVGGMLGKKVKTNNVWKVAAQIPGVDEKAHLAFKYFQTVRQMCLATEVEWREAGFGPEMSKRAVAFFAQGEE